MDEQLTKIKNPSKMSKPSRWLKRIVIFKTAEFSACRIYRYVLWRWWDKTKPYCMFIGLNPSIADEKNDDPTIRRCIGFAFDWGYGGLCMTNLFAFRARNPKDMLSYPNPIGNNNDEWIIKLSRQAGIVIAAWGTKGNYKARDKAVYKLVESLYYLEKTKKGFPKHPLYLKKNIQPKPF